jgi:hypothetical protein
MAWVDIKELSGIDFEDEVLRPIYSEGVPTVVIDVKNDHIALDLKIALKTIKTLLSRTGV